MGRAQRQPGFTLIELLVVVAVIAVLIGVLLPALGKARVSAMQVQCASNQRQIALGWALYAEANDNISVPGQPGRFADERLNVYDVGNGKQYRPRWFASLGAYVGLYAYNAPSADREDEHSIQITSEIFICPEASDWTSTRNSSYGYNHQFLGNARFVDGDESAGFIRFPVRTSQVGSPAATVMFGDSMGTAAGKPAAERMPNDPTGARHPDLLALGGHGYIIDPPRLTDDCDYADLRNREPQHRSAVHDRHSGRANVAFCDGHVESRTLEELGYQVRSDGAVEHSVNSETGLSATNRYFSGWSKDYDPPTLTGAVRRRDRGS